ncbi:glycosyl transferase group 1 [Arthrobacter sp. Hiyo1]|nr:glycosyl transferase group 1 [Arthrobacter sp. Hiyo1]
MIHDRTSISLIVTHTRSGACSDEHETVPVTAPLQGSGQEVIASALSLNYGSWGSLPASRTSVVGNSGSPVSSSGYSRPAWPWLGSVGIFNVLCQAERRKHPRWNFSSQRHSLGPKTVESVRFRHQLRRQAGRLRTLPVVFRSCRPQTRGHSGREPDGYAGRHSRREPPGIRQQGRYPTFDGVWDMVSIPEPEWFLTLLNGWTLTRDGRRVKVAHRQQRLIAALALLGERPRTFLSGLLWPDSSEAQAAVGLRVSIWHINHELPGLLHADGITDVSVALSEQLKVDIIDLERDLHAPVSGLHGSYPRWERLRTAELLPGWYEDWILVEQERFRALRTSALDSIAAYQLSQGNAEETKVATAAAISLEPFRESSYRLLIQAHLATGDLVAALRTYRASLPP